MRRMRSAVAVAWGCVAAMACGPDAARASVCAAVQIEIAQELTLERQAFEARMQIDNALPHLAVENVHIGVTFTDADGETVLTTSDPNDTNALFFITVGSMVGIGGISGDGTVAPARAAEITWLIIPAPGAGGMEVAGVRYFVGARLAYTLGGQAYDMNVAPDSILVRPMPRLTLDYFLPGDVYGDDAFTPEIEAPVPFSVGVRAGNVGYGVARGLRIDSGSARIVENELGLLVGFNMVATEVHGKQGLDGLLLDFGDIAPEECAVGRWVMECTLSGRFEEFAADFSHADELGGQLTSLIESVATHRLVRDVLVDLPGRDAIRDFLACDNGNYHVYESECRDAAVADFSATAVLEQTGGADGRGIWRLTVPSSAGPHVAVVPFGVTDTLIIERATRADGKQLASDNVWFARTRASGGAPWEHYLCLFDVNGGGAYVVEILDASGGAQPPVLAHVGDKVGFVGDLAGIGFLVQASDPNGTIPTLTASWLPAGAGFAWHTNGPLAEGEFFWRPDPGQEGVHPVKFTASDGELIDKERIRIFVGTQGEGVDSNGVPLSVTGRSVVITSLVASSVSSGATLEWTSHPEVLYDVYRSDEGLREGTLWLLAASNLSAAAGGRYVDDALETNRPIRLYQVVLADEAPFAQGVWGVVRRDLPGRAHTLVTPLDARDRRLDGEFGHLLADTLGGHDGGPGDGIGDELHFLDAECAWRAVYLDDEGAWREEDGMPSDHAVPEGQGLLVTRNADATARVTLTGELRNDRTRELTVRPGWNLLTLTEGPERTLRQVFADASNGGPVAGADAASADRVIVWAGTGSVQRLIYATGWGAPYDGEWIDPDGPAIWQGVVRPGQPVFYFRHEAGGLMNVRY